MQEASHQLRCVGCSAVIPPDAVEKDFRCVDCGELLEVEYPSWSAAFEHVLLDTMDYKAKTALDEALKRWGVPVEELDI